jgi:hypothetical protein
MINSLDERAVQAGCELRENDGRLQLRGRHDLERIGEFEGTIIADCPDDDGDRFRVDRQLPVGQLWRHTGRDGVVSENRC